MKACNSWAARRNIDRTMRRKYWRLSRTNILATTIGCSPEFTSLCPITGQPDFAEIKIAYIPAERMVESKSLKLYLFSFRNHGDFHEDCVNIILKDLVALMQPKYIEVVGLFTPRGGISIYPYANYGRPGTKYEQMAQRRLEERQMI